MTKPSLEQTFLYKTILLTLTFISHDDSIFPGEPDSFFFRATEDNWKEKENQGVCVVTHRVLDLEVIQFICSVQEEVVFPPQEV